LTASSFAINTQLDKKYEIPSQGELGELKVLIDVDMTSSVKNNSIIVTVLDSQTNQRIQGGIRI